MKWPEEDETGLPKEFWWSGDKRYLARQLGWKKADHGTQMSWWHKTTEEGWYYAQANHPTLKKMMWVEKDIYQRRKRNGK